MTDFTKGSCLPNLLRFAWPIILGNLLQQLYSVVDSVLLGRMVSTQALSAASAVTPIHNLFVGVITGFSLGASLVLAQAFGAADEKRQRACIENMLLLWLFVCAACTALAFALGPSLLQITNTPQELRADALTYLRILAAGYLAQGLYQFLADALRAMGDSRTPLLFLIISTVLNIVLDTWFIAGFGLGVAGVGWATLLSEVVAAVLCLAYSLWRCPLLRVRHLRPDSRLLWTLAGCGGATALQQTIGSIGGMLQQTVVNGFGSSAIAAYNAAYKIDNLLLLPCIGLGGALSMFAAQNLGAGQRERMREGLRVCVRITAVFSLIASLGIFLAARPLVLCFIQEGETEVITMGVHGLRVLAPLYILCNEISLMTNFFKGANSVGVASAMGIAQIVLRVGIAFSLAGSLGMDAVWLCMPLTWIFSSLFALWYYKSGRWERKLPA